MSQLGDNIRAARTRKGWSQEASAHKLGVTVATWNRWENGANQPALPQLERIAELLGTTVSDLTRGV